MGEDRQEKKIINVIWVMEKNKEKKKWLGNARSRGTRNGHLNKVMRREGV